MVGELESIAQQFFASLDELDLDRLIPVLAEDVEEIDEVSRRWLRGKGEVGGYFTEILKSVSNVKSVLSDAQERIWGDVGLLTCWLDQSYTLDGTDATISAPTTLLFVRQDGTWRIRLFHSYPIPEA